MGDRNLAHARGGLNIPLVADTLAIKLFAEVREKDGYVKNVTTGNNDLANQDRTSSRFQLRYTPNDRTTVDFSASAYDSESDDYFFEHIDGIASDAPKFTSTNDYENNSKIELFNASVTIEHEFENGYTLTSVTALLDDELQFGADVEATPNPIVDIIAFVAAEQFSQELRIASPSDRSYDFVAGLYYDDEDSQNHETILVGPGFPFPPIQNSIFGGGGNTLNRTSWAAFIHANFDLNEQVTLFGGMRYSDETKKQKTHPDTCANFFTCVILGNPALAAITDAPVDITLDEWTWTAGLRYHVHQDLMIYGSIGTGVKSGAFSSTSDPVGDYASNNLVTDPEEVTSYELGIKSSLLDNHVNLNFALFYMDYEDLQVRIGCAQCGPGGIPDRSFSNAAKATAKGFEVEIVAFPTESLKLTAGIGSLDATYDEWVGGVEDPRRGEEFFDVSGNAIALSADWSVNASAQHTTELMGGILSSRLDLSYVDDRYSDGSFHNHPEDIVPSQTLLNGRVSYRPVEDSWGVSLWVKNLTDDDSKVYAAYGSTFLPAASNRAQYQQPRTYGVTINLEF